MDAYWEGWQSVANNYWYWHLRAGNHEIIAHGEDYASKANCQRGIDGVESALSGRTDLKLHWIDDPNA